jgi:glycosyltransferase involved in cell wall biosynthesis
MRILIDLQGAQSGSRYRGIGRYSAALTKAIIRNRGDHEIFILLNGLWSDTVEQIRCEYSRLIPANHIVVFSAPSPAEDVISENAWLREAAELIREEMINDIAPDILLITSLFEGFMDKSIMSIGRLATRTKVAVVLHDLIPFLDPEPYLFNLTMMRWYYSRIESLRKADLLLANSESSRYEAIDTLGFPTSRTTTIYAAADERFTSVDPSPEEGGTLLERLRIRPNFIMHAGIVEPRKNFEGLVRAFALLPETLRRKHQLVLAVGISPPDSQAALRRIASAAGLAPDALVLLSYVPDSELVALYSLCTIFVFPSFHEGFGLPALEAMCCGAAVIGSNTTGIPEVIGRQDALFDPYSDQSIANLMERVLTDAPFLQSLRGHALQQAKRFSWDRSAELALRAMERTAVSRSRTLAVPDGSALLDGIAAVEAGVSPARSDFRMGEVTEKTTTEFEQLRKEFESQIAELQSNLAHQENDYRRVQRRFMQIEISRRQLLKNLRLREKENQELNENLECRDGKFQDLERNFEKLEGYCRKLEESLVWWEEEIGLVTAERDKATAQSLRWFEAAIPNDGEELHSRRQYPLQTFLYRSRIWSWLAIGLRRRRRILVETAKRARDQRDWAVAARYYRDALDLTPDQPGLWVQLGHALKEAGNIAAAEKAYRISLGLDAQIADTHLQLGHVLKLQGRNAEAAEAYMRSLSLAPGSPDAMNELRALGSSLPSTY